MTKDVYAMNPYARAAAALLAAASVLAIASCSASISGRPVAAPPHASSATASGAAPTPGLPAPAPSTTVSDEDQIRQAVMAFQAAYNTQAWDAYLDMMCAGMRAQFTGSVMDYVKKGRTQNGLTNVRVTAVEIRGDTATATFDAQNEILGSRSGQTLPLKLEDGWKICKIN
jgi:hypothetical protein